MAYHTRVVNNYDHIILLDHPEICETAPGGNI